jgi:hypothetical protein
MRVRLRRLSARHPPAGWADIPRQLGVFAAAYLCYRAVAVLAAGDARAAFAHARAVAGVERAMHIFVEPAVQAWASHSRLLIDLAGWAYVNAQFTVMIAALVFVYFRRHASYRPFRDTLLVAMALAIPCYALYPTAPPRLLPGLGFSDSVAHATGLSFSPTTAWFASIANPYAAIPSMHIAFALIVGRNLAAAWRRRVLRLAASAYPALIAFVVIATANHFLLDVLLGVLAALAAFAVRGGARLLRRARTGSWEIATAPSGATG